MDLLPAKSRGILDRRVLRYAAPARERVIRNVIGPIRREHTGTVRYAAVLDGYTLNLHAELPLGAETGTDRADLFLVQGGKHHRIPVRAYRKDSETMLIDTRVLLGGAVGGTPLTKGVWDMRLLATAAGEPVTAFSLEGPLRGTPHSGPTRRPPRSPLDGKTYRVRLSPTGLCRIHVSDARLTAEVEQVELRHTHVDVRFQAVGVPARTPLTVEIGDGVESHTIAPRSEPGNRYRYSFRVPLEKLPEDADDRVWSFHLRAGNDRVPIGHSLNGVRAPSRVFKMSPLLVSATLGRLIRVRAHYTARGHLQIATMSVPSQPHVGGSL